MMLRVERSAVLVGTQSKRILNWELRFDCARLTLAEFILSEAEGLSAIYKA